jgi:predicted RNA-binding protein with PIN domain
MRQIRSAVIFSLLLLTVMTACSQEEHLSGEQMAPGLAHGGTSTPNAMLAYEHSLQVELPGGQLDKRVASVQEACITARFASCQILNIWRDEKTVATLKMRVSPDGVEPLIALTSEEGGRVLRRETSAEDLAEAISDNRRQESMLSSYAKRMDELSKRRDISVSDLITLAREQAEVEKKREALQQEAAQQTRRIETHLLSIHFAEEGVSEDSFISRFAEMLGRFLRGVVSIVEFVLYGLFLLPLFFAAAALWRWAWRRLFVRKTPGGQ